MRTSSVAACAAGKNAPIEILTPAHGCNSAEALIPSTDTAYSLCGTSDAELTQHIDDCGREVVACHARYTTTRSLAELDERNFWAQHQHAALKERASRQTRESVRAWEAQHHLS